MSVGFRLSALGFRLSEFRASGFVSRVSGFRFRILDLGLRFWGLRFRVDSRVVEEHELADPRVVHNQDDVRFAPAPLPPEEENSLLINYWSEST